MRKIKILFLAANPTDTSPLRLGEEVSVIEKELVKARFRDKFDLEQKHAVKAEALSEHLLWVEPDIVHFSGHGSTVGQLYLEDETGKSHPVRARALSTLFSILKDNIRCVVLNACYSEVQAKTISRHIDCVVGMSKAIGDKAAIKFAQGFYRGIGFGRDIETAFRLGCAQIDIQNLDEQDTPKILWKSNEPKTIVFSQTEKTTPDQTMTSQSGIEKQTSVPQATKSYYVGEAGKGSTIIQGENITNIQQILTVNGEFLSAQFAELAKEIEAKPDLDKISKKIALKKTEKVAEGLANAEEKPEELAEALTDAKSYESGKLRWIWNKTKQILTSEEAKRAIERIADKAIQTLIKSLVGVA